MEYTNRQLTHNSIIAIVDCNNFYVSCERAFVPKLKNSPVIVLSNNDGCIVSRSNEAKQLGIAMGAPYFKYEEIIKKNNVAVFSSNYSLYADISRRVMRILFDFAPEVEIYSIDEAFISLNGFNRSNITEYMRLLKQTVYQWTGIPVSIGIASTKTLAKIAVKWAKKLDNGGVYNIFEF